MTILDTFFILFDSDASKLDKGLDESEKKAGGLVDKLKDVDKHADKAGEGLFKLVKNAAGLLGLAMSAHALYEGIKDTAASYDELGKLAARFRSTTDAVDEFRDSAGLLGISEETSTNALRSLDTAVQDTVLGMGRAKKVFEELGIQVQDAHGKIKPTTEVMEELAGKFKGMEKGTQIRVMERLGLDPSLLKLFNTDLTELHARMNEIDRVSGFNLEAAVKRSAEYAKAQKSLTVETNVLRMYLEKLQEAFKVTALPYFTEALTTATKYVRQFVEYLMRHSKLVEGVFVAIGGAILYFLVPAAIKGAIATLTMLAPFLLIGAAVAAVGGAFALLYEDIMTFIEGGDSMIGNILQKWPVIGDVARGIMFALQALWAMGAQVLDFFVTLWDDPRIAFEAFIDMVTDGIKKLLNMIPGMSKMLGFLGIGGETGDALAAGKNALGQASSTGLASLTSTSIANTRASKSTAVSVGKVEVHTQATDAAGISKAIGGSIESQMRQAVNNFDDGVLG